MNLFRFKNGNSTNHKFNQRALVLIPLVLACASLITLAAADVAVASGTTRYVSPTGTDTGDCSNSGSPCLTT